MRIGYLACPGLACAKGRRACMHARCAKKPRTEANYLVAVNSLFARAIGMQRFFFSFGDPLLRFSSKYL